MSLQSIIQSNPSPAICFACCEHGPKSTFSTSELWDHLWNGYRNSLNHNYNISKANTTTTDWIRYMFIYLAFLHLMGWNMLKHVETCWQNSAALKQAPPQLLHWPPCLPPPRFPAGRAKSVGNKARTRHFQSDHVWTSEWERDSHIPNSPVFFVNLYPSVTNCETLSDSKNVSPWPLQC